MIFTSIRLLFFYLFGETHGCIITSKIVEYLPPQDVLSRFIDLDEKNRLFPAATWYISPKESPHAGKQRPYIQKTRIAPINFSDTKGACMKNFFDAFTTNIDNNSYFSTIW